MTSGISGVTAEVLSRVAVINSDGPSDMGSVEVVELDFAILFGFEKLKEVKAWHFYNK